MNRIKFRILKVYNNFLFGHRYVCPVCAEGFSNWSYSPGHCPICGRKLVRIDNRYNLCPRCGESKLGKDYCPTCGYHFMPWNKDESSRAKTVV